MHCIRCGKRAHSELCFNCKPRKPITTRRPIRKIGRVGKATAAAVAKWKLTQKPNHQGYYICYICGRWVTYLEAEHKLSKARHPDKRTDQHNLAPTCAKCNRRKGSNDNG